MALLVLSMPSLSAQSTREDGRRAIKVEGTELAKMPTVVDVLAMLPEVMVENETVTVIGRGKPDIYVDNIKILEFSELMHIPADRVKEIEVLKHPGAEYDKNVESVIVIRIKPDKKDGFSLDNALRFNMTHALATNDELTLGWKKNKLALGAFVGWNENRMNYESVSFTNKYKDHELISEASSTSHPDVLKQWLSSRFSTIYEFRPGSRLSFNYSFMGNVRDESFSPESSTTVTTPETKHNYAIDYSGKLGGWAVSIGNNAFIDDVKTIVETPSSSSNYLRKENDLRIYLQASRSLWKGTISLGAEHELDRMDVTMFEDNPNFTPIEKKYRFTHAIHQDITTDFFVSTKQTLGRWNLEAGLRYEHIHSNYRPCADDGLMMYLDEFLTLLDQCLPEGFYLIPILIKEREVNLKHDYLYPSLKVSTKVGGSTLSFRHTENGVRPYLGLTRLRFSEMEIINEKVLTPERTSSSMLGWEYKWLAIGASHTYSDDPICKTVTSSNKYNAPDYHAMDFDVTLSPKIGCWSPILLANLHKQWFKMPLANGKDRLMQPLFNVTFKNTLTFSKDWSMHFNALWHSRGAERNIYYYSPDFRIDASIQKSLPKRGLTFILDAGNVLRSSYNDVSCYVKEFYGISQGYRSRNVRSVSLTVRYKL